MTATVAAARVPEPVTAPPTIRPHFTSRAVTRQFLTYLVGGCMVVIIEANGFADAVLSTR